MNQYETNLKAVKASKCNVCGGLGECDDMGPGDISYNTWTCIECGGSGLSSLPMLNNLRKVIPNDYRHSNR